MRLAGSRSASCGPLSQVGRALAWAGAGALAVALGAGCESLAGLDNGDVDGATASDTKTGDGKAPPAGGDAGKGATKLGDATTQVDVAAPMDARTHVEAGGGKVEAGVDAGMARDSGPVLTSPWQFVKASATSGNSAESTVTSGVPVAVGDLVIFGCDLATTSTLMSIPAPTGGILEPFQQVGAVAANGCMAIAAWGIVKTVPTGGGFLTMNGPPPPNTSWEDCAMDIFSGGSPVPHLLDGGMSLNPAVRSGVLADASTIVNCGDVDTAPNGVAFSVAYVSGGASFVQPASAPFIQTEDPASNPSGYASPTDGTRINVEIADNIYAYTCMTFSLAP